MTANNTHVFKKVNTRVVCFYNTNVLNYKTMRYGERLRLAREHKKMTQNDLVKSSGVKQGTISKIERGDQDASSFDVELSYALDIDPMWLKTGEKKFAPKWVLGGGTTLEIIPKVPLVESNAHWLGGFDLWDDDTPLDDDEVALPFFREVKLSAGSGAITQVIENHGFKLRFAKSTLRKAGVQHNHAYCVTVEGCSMEPVLPNGCTVGVNTIDTVIQDGKAYAIDQNGELRVKLLYKIAGGGIRVRSYNRDEYPDETITGAALDGFKILGRMFWYSVLL